MFISMRNMIEAYCSYLEREKIIPTVQVSVCIYGLELLVSSAINTGVIMLFSILLHQWSYVGFFFLGFIPMRLFAGGYHADNHLNCSMVFLYIYLCSIYLNSIANSSLIGVMMITEILLVYLLSPVEAINKNLTQRRRKKSRQRSVCIVVSNAAVFILYFLYWKDNTYIAYYLVSGFLASFTMIAGKIKLIKNTQKRREIYYEKNS